MCIIPFKFNGQQYDSCMLMTAQRLTELGVVGFDPKVTLDDVIPVCATKVDPATLLPTQPLKNSLGRCRKDCPKRNSTIYKDEVSIVSVQTGVSSQNIFKNLPKGDLLFLQKPTLNRPMFHPKPTFKSSASGLWSRYPAWAAASHFTPFLFTEWNPRIIFCRLRPRLFCLSIY